MKYLRAVIAVLILTFGLLWTDIFVVGCANGSGVSVRELAFAARVALVVSAEEDPTAEEMKSLVDGALEIAAGRGLSEEQLEAARMIALTAMVVYTTGGDWRDTLVMLLEAIETGENE